MFFLGSLSHSEALKILSDSNIFVLPSDSEGMSNALLEAMAASNAVIAKQTFLQIMPLSNIILMAFCLMIIYLY